MSTLVIIGDFSRIMLLSVKALRRYHVLGLYFKVEILARRR